MCSPDTISYHLVGPSMDSVGLPILSLPVGDALCDQGDLSTLTIIVLCLLSVDAHSDLSFPLFHKWGFQQKISEHQGVGATGRNAETQKRWSLPWTCYCFLQPTVQEHELHVWCFSKAARNQSSLGYYLRLCVSCAYECGCLWRPECHISWSWSEVVRGHLIG